MNFAFDFYWLKGLNLFFILINCAIFLLFNDDIDLCDFYETFYLSSKVIEPFFGFHNSFFMASSLV